MGSNFAIHFVARYIDCAGWCAFSKHKHKWNIIIRGCNHPFVSVFNDLIKPWFMTGHGLFITSYKITATTVYPKKYAHGFCFAVLCCGYTLTDFPISIRPTSLALWQSNYCPSASKAALMNMDKYFMWIHYEQLHKHNKAKHNKTVCIFLGIYCIHRQYHFIFLVKWFKALKCLVELAMPG